MPSRIISLIGAGAFVVCLSCSLEAAGLGGATGAAGGVATGLAGAAGSAISGLGASAGAIGGSLGAGSVVGGVANGALNGTTGGAGPAVGGVLGGLTSGVGQAGASVGGAVGNLSGGLGAIGGALSGGEGSSTASGGFGGFSGSSADPRAAFAPGGAVAPAGSGPVQAVGRLAATAVVALPLPSSLAPLPAKARRCSGWIDQRLVRGDCQQLAAYRGLHPRPGAPENVVQSCRETVVASALRYGVMRVDAASAGPMGSRGANIVAPIEFVMLYRRDGGLQVRHATVGCEMNRRGQVIAAL